MAGEVSLEKPVLETLLNTGEYSDLTIKCKDKIFKVHRSIICIQSKPFAAMINGPFKEAITGVIDLPDDDPEIIERVIKFMYTTDYPDDRHTPSSNPKLSTNTLAISPMVSLPVHVKVYIAADKWDIAALRSLAASKYSARLQIQDDLATFVASLGLIFNEIPENNRVLKDTAMKFIGKHHKQITSNTPFVELCSNNAAIAVAAMKVVSDAPPCLPLCPNKSCKRKKMVQTNVQSDWKSFGIYRCDFCEENFN